MASTDALPIPRKNVAYRVYFPISKSDGTLITGAASPDTELSKDGGTFADLTDEVHELATSSGIYYVDLTNTEMNADCVILKITTTSLGAITQVVIMYPQEAGDIRVNPTYWNDTAVATPDTAGYPKVTIKSGTGTGEISLTSGIPDTNVTKVSGASQTARDLGAQLDATVSSRMATFTLPTNFNTLSIDSSGRVTVISNQDKSSYVLSAAGVQAIWDALTSALTTNNSIGKLLVTDIDAAISSRSTYAGGDTSGVTTLLARITAARAGYWDNLNVGGAVASNADILALNQSASRRIVLVVVPQFERPESGNASYTIEARTYDGDGAPVNADSTPTLTATGIISGSLSGNLSVASNPATGVYRWTYTYSSSAVLEQIRFDLSAIITAVTFTMSAYSQVVDLVSATWTSTDAAHLSAIFNKLPSRSFITGSEASTGSVADDVLDVFEDQGYTDTRAGYLDVLNGIVAAVQSGLATSAGLTALQSHGDSTWATANISSLLTTVAFNAALATLSSHGDSTWSTANISTLLTTAAFNAAMAALQTHGDSTWASGDLSGLLTTTAFNAAIAVLEGLIDDVPTAVENREEMDENSNQLAAIRSSTDLLSANSTVISNPVVLTNNTLVLYKSDDYTSVSGRSLPRWSSDDWADYDLTHAQEINFYIAEQSELPASYGTITALDDTILELEIEASEMTGLHSGTSRYSYKVIAQLSVALGGDHVTLIDSALIIKNYFNIRD